MKHTLVGGEGKSYNPYRSAFFFSPSHDRARRSQACVIEVLGLAGMRRRSQNYERTHLSRVWRYSGRYRKQPRNWTLDTGGLRGRHEG